MPPHELDPDAPLRHRADVEAVVAALAFPSVPEHPIGRVGIEAEFFPLREHGLTRHLLDDADGVPGGIAVLRGRPRTWSEGDPAATVTKFTSASGGEVTFEPGGQVEYATTPSDGVSAALRELEAATRDLAGAYAQAGTRLVAAGLDVWNAALDVPQQLRGPRYPAMSAYFASRGVAPLACATGAPHPFAVMMRHTCATQISLDPGVGTVADERWAVANLLAPFAVAAFANSPGTDGLAVRSCRARAWRRLDPTRTGFAPGIVGGTGWDRHAQVVAAAMAADVMIYRRGEAGHAGTPGTTFGDWLATAHPLHGVPTVGDLRAHLTTLFHEVRPRGALEIRSVDALPAAWRAAPVVLYAGALYDDSARGRIFGLLEPLRADLDHWLERAGDGGVADPSFCPVAVAAWSYALDGARRLGAPYVAADDLAVAEAFIDRYTTRGRAPSDELRELLARDRDAAAAWAAEPLPSTHRR